MWQVANPFDELYAGEMVMPDQFVGLFSPVLVEYSAAMFQEGNVVLRGTEGSGKTMLLALLKPAVRVAYAHQGVELPVPENQRKFIGAGVSIKRSAAMDFGQRAIGGDEQDDALAAICFGDFLNYWIVIDMLASIRLLGTALDGKLARDVGIDYRSAVLDECVRGIAELDCWQGFLGRQRSLGDLLGAMQDRIGAYRSFLNYSRDTIPSSILSTLSPVGESVGAVAELLTECGLVDESTALYVRIDEYDALSRLKTVPADRATNLTRIVNKALALRDSRVKYRIGTRPYGWRDMRVFGTADLVLENERDYSFFDIDEELGRQGQDTSKTVFARFAEDVLKRRMTEAGMGLGSGSGSLVERLFGQSESLEEKAQRVVGERSQKRGLALSELSPAWTGYLLSVSHEDPLSAKLGEAWYLQQQRRGGSPPAPSGSPPWVSSRARIWRSSRRPLALLQMAWVSRKRITWAGREDILRLSGNHILAFLSICRYIWSAWSRSCSEEERSGFPFDVAPPAPRLQSAGIYTASAYWHEKVLESPEGHALQDFLDHVAIRLRRGLLEDMAMSYPGGNGFSLRRDELVAAENQEVLKHLMDAVDFGHVIALDHSTKASDRRGRRKFYLRPMLAPYYQLVPHRFQEPLYVEVSDVREWVHASQEAEEMGVMARGIQEKTNPCQQRLPLGEEGADAAS